MKTSILSVVSKTIDTYQMQLRDQDMKIVSLETEIRDLKIRLGVTDDSNS